MAYKGSYHNMVVNAAIGAGVEATITVYAAGTTDLSTIYSDLSGTAKDNPFTTDSVGRFSFYADPGLYDIKVSGSDITTYTLEGVAILGIQESAGFVVPSNPTAGQYQIKGIKLNASKKVVIVYDETPES